MRQPHFAESDNIDLKYNIRKAVPHMVVGPLPKRSRTKIAP